jgi:AraC family transcriptional regulator
MIVLLKPRLIRQGAAEQSGTLGGFSFIISETARRHHWSGAGCLSIKSFHGGEALYDVGRGRYRVGPSSYLILNQSQPYEIIVDSEKALESFCVFFEDGFAEEVNYGLITPAAKLLDNPRPAQVEPVRFFEKTYPHDDILSPALFRFKTALQDGKDDEVWINERLHELIGRLLQVHRGVCREVESLPAMRASTREELYRRIHRAKEFIAASYEEPITIDEMARVACLSTNHFLRTFRQAFRQTPHQFLTAQRLERARKLLLHTDLSITEICLSVGFESPGSFSSLFRRKVGSSPEQFRRSKR